MYISHRHTRVLTVIKASHIYQPELAQDMHTFDMPGKSMQAPDRTHDQNQEKHIKPGSRTAVGAR